MHCNDGGWLRRKKERRAIGSGRWGRGVRRDGGGVMERQRWRGEKTAD